MKFQDRKGISTMTVRFARTLGAALAGLVIATVGANAQDQEILVRSTSSTGELPAKAVVEYVAQNSEPLTFRPEQNPGLSSFTIRQFMEQLCGSVQEGYAEIFIELNRNLLTPDYLESDTPTEQLKLDQPLGEVAFRLEWPICLYALKTINTNYEVKDGDTLSHIRRRFTGAPDENNKRSELDQFFKQSPVQLPKDPGKLQPGTPLVIPIITVSTPLKPSVPVEKFTRELKEVARGSVTIKEDAQSPGRIILPPKEGNSMTDDAGSGDRISRSVYKDINTELGSIGKDFAAPAFKQSGVPGFNLSAKIERAMRSITMAISPNASSPREDYSGNPAEALRTDRIPLSTSSTAASLAADETSHTSVDTKTCKDSASGYPIDAVAIENAYEYARKGISRENVHLLILDNGFFGVPCENGTCPPFDASGTPKLSGERFAAKYFDLKRFSNSLGPTLFFLRDLAPINYANEPFRSGPKPASLDGKLGHGTHVAGIALGGVPFESHRKALTVDDGAWLKLLIANVANGKGELPPAFDEYLLLFLQKVKNKNVTRVIANMSLGLDVGFLDETRESIRKEVSDHSDVLFVTAAGNQGSTVTNAFFPAALGGRESVNVLTVTSIDANDELSWFSNKSAEKVDLAAPGCKIESWWDADGPSHPENGTSAAAPFVTFGGALLWSIWPSAQPIHIKKRLVYSGDLIPSPGGKEIWSHAKLNIAKALFIDQDLIRYRKDGKEIALMGEARPVEGFTCNDGHSSVEWKELNSYKRAQDGSGWLFHSDTSQALKICQGKLASLLGNQGEQIENKVFFGPKFQIVGNEILPHEVTEIEIDADEIIEIVRKDQAP